jgi:hypothetical protein
MPPKQFKGKKPQGEPLNIEIGAPERQVCAVKKPATAAE